jgi:hypothetical protein
MTQAETLKLVRELFVVIEGLRQQLSVFSEHALSEIEFLQAQIAELSKRIKS